MKDRNLWIWGQHSIQAALEECIDLVLELKLEERALQDSEILQSFEAAAQDAGVACHVVRELPKDYREKRAQGCVALMKRAPVQDPRDLSQYLSTLKTGDSQPMRQWALLDRIEDPHNFGAILRSAAAFGLEGVFFADKQQAPVTGVVVQASAGQCFRTSLYEFSNLNLCFKIFEEMESLHPSFAALDMDGTDLDPFVQKARSSGCTDLIWLLGSEGRGLRPGLLDKASDRVSISMEKNVESLNVSVASALAFYAAYRK